MKRSLILLSIMILLGRTQLMSAVRAEDLEAKKSPEEILQYWAPQVYQDVRNDRKTIFTKDKFYYAQDQITKVDFDGDWDATNNDIHSRHDGGMEAYAYSSYIETETHYYLGYGFYHAYDDAVLPFDRHENDYEDVYLCVKKVSNGYGEFLALITQAHGKYNKYQKNDLFFDLENGEHVKIFISSNGDVINDNMNPNAKGHSIFKYIEDYWNIGNDAIVYNVGDFAAKPSSFSGKFTSSYTYQLISINQLYEKRDDAKYSQPKGKLFNNAGNKLCYDGEAGGADMPWIRSCFYDPARYFAEEFGIKATGYLDNPYKI